MKEPKLGSKVKFIPTIYIDKNGTPIEPGHSVYGHVVFINKIHKLFTVKYTLNGHEFLESFKFCDIGKAVKVYG